MGDHERDDILMHSEHREDGWYVIVRVVPSGHRDLPFDHPDVQAWEYGPVDTEEEVEIIRDRVRKSIAQLVTRLLN